jgi:cation diffusion facilitator family transporter
LNNFLRNKHKVIYLSIGAALVTLAMKFTAYYLTDSVGLLGDAAESLVNLAAAIIATVFLLYASKPADPSHTYGHDKAEYFASGVEGGLILIAAVGIAYSATLRLISPVALENLNIGLVVAILAAGVNYIVARILLIAARQHDSITLEADAKHLLTDVWTSIGVVAGLSVVAITGLTILDVIIAYALAINIVFSGLDLLKRSFRGLMDYSLPPEEKHAIEKIFKKHSQKVINYHNLRTRKSGPSRFIDVHILVAGETTVQEAHDLCEVIEKQIEAALAKTQVTIHVEPVEDYSSWDVVKGIAKKKN